MIPAESSEHTLISLNLHILVLNTDTRLNFFFSIPLEAVLLEGSLPPAVHRVVKDEEYRGEIKIALTFTPAEVNISTSLSSSSSSSSHHVIGG
jgi:hypothetical protein